MLGFGLKTYSWNIPGIEVISGQKEDKDNRSTNCLEVLCGKTSYGRSLLMTGCRTSNLRDILFTVIVPGLKDRTNGI